jgi:hypothetical protein
VSGRGFIPAAPVATPEPPNFQSVLLDGRADRHETYRRNFGSVVDRYRNICWGFFAMPQTAEYWQERAKQAKAEAERMQDPECKEIMLDIAKAYERIADLARQERGDPKR